MIWNCQYSNISSWNLTCRTQRIFKQLGLEDYTEVNIQVLGAEDTYGPHAVNTVGWLFLFLCSFTIRTNNLQFLKSVFDYAGSSWGRGLDGRPSQAEESAGVFLQRGCTSGNWHGSVNTPPNSYPILRSQFIKTWRTLKTTDFFSLSLYSSRTHSYCRRTTKNVSGA